MKNIYIVLFIAGSLLATVGMQSCKQAAPDKAAVDHLRDSLISSMRTNLMDSLNKVFAASMEDSMAVWGAGKSTKSGSSHTTSTGSKGGNTVKSSDNTSLKDNTPAKVGVKGSTGTGSGTKVGVKGAPPKQ